LKVKFPKITNIVSHIEPNRSNRLIEFRSGEVEHKILDLVKKNPILSNCHDILISHVTSELYNVSFHCEANANAKVHEIHQATVVLEDEIKEEMPFFSDITIHVEPIE
jgi:divalent metal cation (Fe/Co/Zn/Cd) transporter